MEGADLSSQADSVDRPPGVTISPKMRSMRAPSASAVLPGDTVEVDECRWLESKTRRRFTAQPVIALELVQVCDAGGGRPRAVVRKKCSL